MEELIKNVSTAECYLYNYDVPAEEDDTLLESIIKCGVIDPLLARKTKYGYEIYVGRRRFIMALTAGLKFVPIIERNIADNEVDAIILETIVNQKGLDALSFSQLSKLIYEYFNKIKSQGRRSDLLENVRNILLELETNDLAFNPKNNKINSCKESGKKFRMSARNVSRYLRIHELDEELQKVLDSKSLSLKAAVELSYIDKTIQRKIATLVKNNNLKLTYDKAVGLRYKQMKGELKKQDIIKYLYNNKVFSEKDGFSSMKSIFKKYGLSVYKQEEVEMIVDKALGMYFKYSKLMWNI